MTTQKFMGRHSLIKRLTAQIGNKETALAVLRKRGQMEQGSEKLTAKGRARDAMTAEERAKDRTAKRTGQPANNLSYDPKTNRAQIRGPHGRR